MTVSAVSARALTPSTSNLEKSRSALKVAVCGVQILTHMREKLQFVMRSNKMLRKEVHALGGDLATKRDALAKVKAHRDKLRVGARSIKEGSLYIDNPMLLEDMKKQVRLLPLEWMAPVCDVLHSRCVCVRAAYTCALIAANCAEELCSSIRLCKFLANRWQNLRESWMP